MSTVNYKGVESICRYLKSINGIYFAIYPIAKNGKPVFAQKQKISQSKAAEILREWCEIVLSGDAEHTLTYELRVYDCANDTEIDDGGEVDFKAGRQGLAVTFSLQTKEPATVGSVAVPQPTSYPTFNIEELRTQIRIEFENAELRKLVAKLESENAELKAIVEEYEADDEAEDSSIAGIPTNQLLQGIMGHLFNNQPPAVAGVGNIPQAPEKELLTDGELGAVLFLKEKGLTEADLLKLVEMSKSAGTWSFMLSTLRK